MPARRDRAIRLILLLIHLGASAASVAKSTPTCVDQIVPSGGETIYPRSVCAPPCASRGWKNKTWKRSATRASARPPKNWKSIGRVATETR